jgi:hypothetical protein
MRAGKRKNSKIVNIFPEKKRQGRTADRGARRAIEKNKAHPNEVANNLRAARSIWGPLPRLVLNNLRELTERHHVSVPRGDVTLLGEQLYVTHAGLLRIGERDRCSGIVTRLQQDVSDPGTARWVFEATVYRTADSKGFVGYGDADPSNVSSLVRGCELRIAETRAVNRALRKAYGIGLCSVEELGSQPASIPPLREGKAVGSSNGNGSTNGQPRLRDKLCLLIRKYELDPGLVKRYAADFCGTESLRDAGRDLVEAFVATVAEEAAKDRAALICKLNSYSQPQEVHS